MTDLIRMAQYGTKHGHAAGKLVAMLNNPRVELAGVYEPDVERRRQLAQTEGPYREVHWFGHAEEMLNDAAILAIASEGLNAESLDQTEQVVAAGKHVWYDKPAGEDWPKWQGVVSLAFSTSQTGPSPACWATSSAFVPTSPPVCLKGLAGRSVTTGEAFFTT
jgi:hypothetical protein